MSGGGDQWWVIPEKFLNSKNTLKYRGVLWYLLGIIPISYNSPLDVLKKISTVG